MWRVSSGVVIWSWLLLGVVVLAKTLTLRYG